VLEAECYFMHMLASLWFCEHETNFPNGWHLHFAQVIHFSFNSAQSHGKLE
jgi:hypothetical protein